MSQLNKKLLIVANWKMTPATLAEANKRAVAFATISKTYKKVNKSNVSLQVLVCPPYPLISILKSAFAGSPTLVGSQDASFFEMGSKTGEVSASLIHSIGASYSIVGHSERRAMGDTDEIVAVKMGQILLTKMNAILCIGETERDAEGLYLDEIKRQIKSSLSRMSNTDFANLVIAYEPVWAIGKKDVVVLTGHELHQMVIYIRKVLRDLYNDSIATGTKILYGGSVNAENAEDIIWNGEVDGLLIGRASFDPKSFEDICSAIILPTISESKVKDIQKIRDIKTSLQDKKNKLNAESHTLAQIKTSSVVAKKSKIIKQKVKKTKAKPLSTNSKSAKSTKSVKNTKNPNKNNKKK